MDFLAHTKAGKYSWYHSNHPLNLTQRQELTKNFGFLQHHVDSTEKGKTPRPKISSSKKYLYFVFHIPYLPSNSNKFTISDLNIFITKDSLVTIESQGNLPALETYFSKTAATKRTTERRLKHGPVNLFLNLIKYLLNDLETLIDAQGERVDELNKKIFQTKTAKSFIESVSVLRYNQIVSFTALERQARVFETYSNDKNPLTYYSKNSDPKWGSVIETFQTLTYELHADIDHLEGLVKTFETLVTYRTNETIKILTVFSVLLLPLTLLSGIYGMNFAYLPLSQTPTGFFIIIASMFFIAALMLFVFKFKKWL